MTYLNGSGILNDVLSMTQDQGTALRAKCLLWLNVAAQKLAVVRPWLFLNKSVTVTPVNNVITKPLDYGEFQGMSFGILMTMDERNRLNPGETFQADNAVAGFALPIGFTEDQTTITIHGSGYTTPIVLSYTIEPPAITDSLTDTVWPVKCRAVFMESALAAYTKYDMDERFTGQLQISMAELAELKKWDNSQKPKTQYSRRGYRRTR